MSDNKRKINVRLIGRRADEGLVHLNEFARLCSSLMKSLRTVEHDITHKNPRTKFRITDLKCESAAVEIEPIPASTNHHVGNEVVDLWTETVVALESGDPIDQRISFNSLESMRDLYKPIWNRNGLSDRGKLQVDGITLTSSFVANSEKLLHTPIRSSGSVSGILAKLNVRNKNEFTLYPPVGGFHVSCTFPEELLNDVRRAVKRNITVTGTLYYRESQPYPVRVEVQEIDVHPDNSSLPKLSELRGICPYAAGGRESVAAIRSLRDA